MSEEGKDMDIDGLFRNMLEENEVEADDLLAARFMRRLGRREFMRFNPSRFNIYYAAAAAVAGAAVAGLLFFGSPGRGGDEASVPSSAPRTQLDNQPEATATVKPGSESVAPGSVPPAAAPLAKSDSVMKEYMQGDDRPDTGALNTASPDKKKKKAQQSPAVPSAQTGDEMTCRAVISTSTLSGCVPLSVSFRNGSGNNCTASWDFGDGGTSSEQETEYVFDLPGRYTVTLNVTDDRGRTGASSITVEAWPRPEAAFEIRKGDPTAEGNRALFTNLSEGAVKYLWSFGDGSSSVESDPEHSYTTFGRYDVRLVAWSANGCADSVTVTDAFTDKGMFLRFPNAFMPDPSGPTGGYFSNNTDAANRVFHPVASGVAVYNLKIYNKTGMLIFESNDLEMGWDGYYKGQICAPGVYVWKVRGSYRNGQSIVMGGDVVLLNY